VPLKDAIMKKLALIPFALIVGCVADVTVHVEATATDGDSDTDACVPEPEDHPEACMNGVDDDCDGAVDCEQPPCQDMVPECSCTGESEDHPIVCMDGVDNDCDGVVDCDDFQCQQVLPECEMCTPDEHDCYDNVDNDCNGEVDCRDPQCEPECDAMMCQAEDHPIVCQDAVDNDCDGLVNCMDPQCQAAGVCGEQCGNAMLEPAEECDGPDLGGQTCVSLGFDGGMLSCAADCTFDASGCTSCMPAPEICDDGLDNDCDGATDCADATCAGVPPCP
jgi:hypothetical protein